MVESIEFESTIDGKKVKFKLLEETLDIERQCDTEYHIAYTQLLAKGILPRAKLESRMKEQGIWEEDDEKRLQDLQNKLVTLQIELEGANTHEEGMLVAKNMGELRAACLSLVEVKAAVLSNSCESLAENIRRDAYLAYATVYADTDKKVFSSYEDFLSRSSEQIVIDAREVVYKHAGERFSESLTSLPEVNYVRKAEAEIEKSAAKTTRKKATCKKATAKKTTRKTSSRKTRTSS